MSEHNIVSQLIWRHTTKLRNDYGNILIDALIMMSVQALEFGYFLPALGAPASTIGSALVGSIMLLMVSSGYNYMFPLTHEIEHGGTFAYLMTLPVPAAGIILSYLLGFVVEFMAFGLPAIACAVLLQAHLIKLSPATLIAAILFFILSLFFFSTFFFMLVIAYPAIWFRTNTWSRILGPLMAIGATYVSLASVYQHKTYLAYLLLLNPFTYVAEGLRATLLQQPNSLPAWLCTIVLIVLSIVNLRLLVRGLRKRIDPVLL